METNLSKSIVYKCLRLNFTRVTILVESFLGPFKVWLISKQPKLAKTAVLYWRRAR
jgi:hypothetical protein